MDAASTRASVVNIQNAFHTLSILQLTQHLYPLPAKVTSGSTFDFIVVGAGTAGSVVASRLAEDRKTKVLLIEAGGDPSIEVNFPKTMGFIENSYVDWNYSTEVIDCLNCHRNRRENLGLGKMLGGSSGISYFSYNEGNRLDYDFWATAANDSRWNADGVLPYFIKSQRVQAITVEKSPDKSLFGYEGPIILTKENRSRVFEYLNAFKELGYPVVSNVNIKRPIGYTSFMYAIGDGVRQNTGLKYLSPVKDYPNLKVLKNTEVTKILYDNYNNAIGVKARTKTGKKMILKANKEIILSAGAINSPKLLMLSEIGPKNHLRSLGIKVRSDLPVGKNLLDHTSILIINSMKNTPPMPGPWNALKYPAVAFNGVVAINKTQQHPDYQTNNFINYYSEFLPYCIQVYGLRDEICNKLAGKYRGNTYPDNHETLFTSLSNLHPRSKGEVLLRSNNYNDPPIVNPKYLSDKADLDNDAKYIQDFMRVIETQTFHNMKAVWEDPHLDQCEGFVKKSIDYWRCYSKCIRTSFHDYCGTCALGSVVDSKLRVKGVKRLRVVDASIIPKIPRFQILGATIMIGEKASDIIKKDHRL